MDCRGHEKRLHIAQEWNIKPVAHIKLINGKEIPGDAGGTIKDSYFIFECTHKTIDKRVEYIHCGKAVAKDFEMIIKEPLPAIFNPLKSIFTERTTGDDGTAQIQPKWNLARKQLYNAVMLLIVAWNAKEDTPLFKIKEKIEAYPHVSPPLFLVRSVNTILSQSNKTLYEIIEDLKKNNDIRIFEFNLIINILNENEIKQFFK